LSGQPVFLGIDVGTSGCRLAIIDSDGLFIGELALPLPEPAHPGPGQSQQEPVIWWETVRSLLKTFSNRYAGYQPQALAIDGTSSTLLICDNNGAPLHPALMYNDNRSLEQLAILQKTAPNDSPVLAASSSLAKALFFHAHFSERKNAHLLHQSDWLLGQLAGRFDVSDENNCLKLGYDATHRQWPDWLARLPIPKCWFPQVFPAGTPIGLIDRRVSEELGLPDGLQLITGTTDSTAAALATGISRPGQAVTCLGSTLVLKILSEKPIFAAEQGIYSQRIGDLWLVGGASNSGGNVLRKLFTEDEIAGYTSLIDPDNLTGLDYYPLSTPGERFPVNSPDLVPRLAPQPKDRARFFQGVLEGIARIEAQGYHLLMRLGTPEITEIHSIGGGSVNQPWREIRERFIGKTVLIAPHQQAAFGAALLAMRSSS